MTGVYILFVKSKLLHSGFYFLFVIGNLNFGKCYISSKIKLLLNFSWIGIQNHKFPLSISISATESKAFWLYFPIMILLSINALMFTFAVSKVCSLSKAEKKLGLRSGDRNQNMEK